MLGHSKTFLAWTISIIFMGQTKDKWATTKEQLLAEESFKHLTRFQEEEEEEGICHLVEQDNQRLETGLLKMLIWWIRSAITEVDIEEDSTGEQEVVEEEEVITITIITATTEEVSTDSVIKVHHSFIEEVEVAEAAEDSGEVEEEAIEVQEDHTSFGPHSLWITLQNLSLD